MGMKALRSGGCFYFKRFLAVFPLCLTGCYRETSEGMRRSLGGAGPVAESINVGPLGVKLCVRCVRSAAPSGMRRPALAPVPERKTH